MRIRRLWLLAGLTLVATVATLVGCGGSGSKSPTSAEARPSTEAATPTATRSSAAAGEWTKGYPNSIAVLGHSGSTGEGSDPNQPGVEVRENSWATGGNPKVNSVYLRILAHNPAIKGHSDNYARGGADVRALAEEASLLLHNDPKPALVLIQIMDSDLTCPVEPAALSDFRARLTATVKKIARRAPHSRQFVISQFGSVQTYAESLTRAERASQGGTGPCDFMTPTGAIAPKKVVRAEKAIHAYEAALKSACEVVRHCTYDGGAYGRIVDRREYVSSDLNHLSVIGHAKAAAVVWAALRRTGVLPRRR
jgi:hypothetical protein